MRCTASLVASLCVLAASATASAQDRSACRQALENLSSAASSASFEASRVESDCRDADTRCDTLRSCRVLGDGDVSGLCQSQQLACESAQRRCSSVESTLERSLGAVRSAVSSAELSCR